VQDLSWTDRQRECIEFPGPQLLVTGPPGTGKTLVLLKRACRFSQAMPTARVLVVTYNRALAQYARDQLRLNGAGPLADAVTFHSWASRQLRNSGYSLQVISESDRLLLLRQLVDQVQTEAVVPPMLRTRPSDWWRDEVDWIKGNALMSWELYSRADRTGRGQGLRLAARDLVWRVFSRYQQQLAAQGQVDFRDFALLLLRAWTPMPEAVQVSHVLIDEAQDLRYAELKVLNQVPVQSITVVADRTQKIYGTGFAWRDLGFDVRGGGRAKLLTKSYRTTRQVALLAASLRRHDMLVQPGDPDYVVEELPDREGPLPVLVAARDDQHERELVTRLTTHLQAERPLQTIGVLARTWETLRRLEPALRAAQLSYAWLRDEQVDIQSTPGVKLATFHSAKGLEFEAVILVGLSEGLFPPPLGFAMDAAEGEDAQDLLSTERRLLYVAMTRTRHALYLLHGRRPSRFLAELDPTLFTCTALELAAVTVRP
jgi:superfamily I DNA/RNA helicase